MPWKPSHRKPAGICGRPQADGTACTNAAGCRIPHPPPGGAGLVQGASQAFAAADGGYGPEPDPRCFDDTDRACEAPPGFRLLSRGDNGAIYESDDGSGSRIHVELRMRGIERRFEWQLNANGAPLVRAPWTCSTYAEALEGGLQAAREAGVASARRSAD